MILETIRNFLVTKLDCKVVMERAAKMPDRFVLLSRFK